MANVYSYNTAMLKLSGLKTVDDFKELLSETNSRVIDAPSNYISLLYSDMVGNVSAAAIANSIADSSGGLITTISDSEQGHLLSDPDFLAAFDKAAIAEGYSPADALVLYDGGTLSDGTVVDGGLWGDASEAYASTSNSILTITPNTGISADDSVGQSSTYFTREVQAVIDNGIPVNGISPNLLSGMTRVGTAVAIDAASKEIMSGVQVSVSNNGIVDGVLTGELFPAAEVNTLSSAPSTSSTYSVAELLANEQAAIQASDPAGASGSTGTTTGTTGSLSSADATAPTDSSSSTATTAQVTAGSAEGFKEGAYTLGSSLNTDSSWLSSVKVADAASTVLVGASFYSAWTNAQQEAAAGNRAA